MTASSDTGFDLDLRTILPRVLVYAQSLTRDGDRADALVQQTVRTALADRHSFQAGTNFAGWIFRIEFNAFIAELKRSQTPVRVNDERAGPVRTTTLH
jgi:RNA polymerase sigma-70 factor (ECF subfamily)